MEKIINEIDKTIRQLDKESNKRAMLMKELSEKKVKLESQTDLTEKKRIATEIYNLQYSILEIDKTTREMFYATWNAGATQLDELKKKWDVLKKELDSLHLKTFQLQETYLLYLTKTASNEKVN